MLKQVVKQMQRKEEDSRNNCQVGGLHQIIKISCRGIIHILCLSLCGIHPLVCMVMPQLLILVLAIDLYVMEGYQIILLINDQEPKYLFFSYAWCHGWIHMVDIFDIVLSVKYSWWLLESSHEIHFDSFWTRGAWYMHLDLLHGCDNLINQLANKAKVLVWLLFFTIVLFVTSSR